MRLPSLLTIITTIILFGFVASDAQGNEIKLALFSTFDAKECFLLEAELEKFAGVLQRLKRNDDSIRGKFIPQKFVYYYWTYSKSEKSLKKHSISFAANGRSVNWKIRENDSQIIVSLTQSLLKRAKK